MSSDSAAYQLSFGPVLWPLFGEMFPAAIRARAIVMLVRWALGSHAHTSGLSGALAASLERQDAMRRAADALMARARQLGQPFPGQALGEQVVLFAPF